MNYKSEVGPTQSNSIVIRFKGATLVNDLREVVITGYDRVFFSFVSFPLKGFTRRVRK